MPDDQPTHDPLAPVNAHLTAFNARDVEAVLATFADDAVFAAGDQVVVGARALRAVFSDAFAAPVGAELSLRRAVVQGDVVACELTERLTASEGRHELDVAAFYTVREGRLARVRIYRDVLGPPPRQ